MKISEPLQCLSKLHNNPEVLTNPQLFLGPNCETVLRWWLYYESLTYEQKNELSRRWCGIERDTHFRRRDLAQDAAIEVIGGVNMRAVWNATIYPSITYELIAMHLLLERGHQLTFVPLIKDL